MSGQHTPGPWYVISGPGHTDRAITANILGGETVATLGTERQTIESLEANGRLIAAAPDLLESLRRAASELERYVDLQQKLDYIEYAADTQKKLDAVNTIIAKAEGHS